MERPIILTVDDDPDVLRSIARDLRKRFGDEYRIVRAESGSAALDALDELKQRKEPVALLLSDQRMPGMDGVTFLEQAAQRYPKARRVILTAYADTDAAISAINKSQVDYYLLKPWDPPEEKLFPVLEDLLGIWRSEYKPGYGGLRVIGSRWDQPTHLVKDFLARNHVPYTYLDAEAAQGDEEVQQAVADAGNRLPVVLLADGERLAGATPADVARKVGLRGTATQAFYDLAIVGGGPAGLAAAVYAASEGLKTVLIEREAPGGQAGTSSRIENYLGFPVGLSGADLARRAVTQAKRFGVEILTPAEAEAVAYDGPYKRLRLGGGESEISCHALMLTMGVAWNYLRAECADQFAGRGIYYGAAMTEALNCKDQCVYIVGAGNSAGQAAMFFKDYAARVVMLVRGESLAAKMSHYLVERIEATPNIEVRTDAEIVRCAGSGHLENIVVRNRKTGEEREEGASYVFVFIGAAPRTSWLGGEVLRDRGGFILTGPDLPLKGDAMKHWPLERAPFLLEASVPGVFAAGDVRHESVKRVASAVGEGSVAVHFIHRHLASL
ncbi:MAG: FAD-dependent oxidoreductase [Bryobacterales bacterium]|nr:FAD-dependent oxidoreductase [Bryobacterales bacterium]